MASLNDLPEPLKTILIGAAGDFLGGLGSAVAGRLLAAGGYAVAKTFRPPPRQQALNRAMAQALWTTARQLN